MQNLGIKRVVAKFVLQLLLPEQKEYRAAVANNLIPTKDFAECFEQWRRCWENCVRSQGAYFEGE